MPSALLVHGLQSSSAGWWQVDSWLREAGWEVATRDLLGHGGRPPADDYSLGAYADDLDDGEDWDLVIGHSLGGAVSTTIAARRPSWASRLILVDPALRVAETEESALIADLEREQSVTAERLAAQEPLWHPNDVSAKLFALSGVDPLATSRTVAANRPWDVTGLTSGLRVPTLLLTGDPAVDTMIPPELAARIVAGNPLIEHRVVPRGGHSPHRDRAGATRAALLDWLAASA